MAFWNKNKAPKPKKGADPAEDEVRGGLPEADEAPKADPAADRQRLKKIRKMKQKFDETVWANVVDTMQKSIPQFTIMEPDPENEGAEIARYVLLGFDTKIVDDFANKSDEDVGSFMTAIKSSMDCVIEYSLFDNELILVIPTARSLAALAEFEDVFNLKFFVIYATADHQISMETKSPDVDDDFIFITLEEVRKMLADNVYVKDQIHMLQGRSGESTSLGGISGDGIRESEGGGDDAMGEDEYESAHGPLDQEDGPPEDPGEESPDIPDEGDGGAPDAEEVRGAVDKAAAKARGAGSRVSGQKDEIAPDADESAGGAQPQAPAPPAPPKVPGAGQVGGGVKPAGAKAAISRIAKAAQTASDKAMQDPEIQQAQQGMAPQQRAEFDALAMDQYVSRKYYSDDLGLEISSQPFDAMFVSQNGFQGFEIDEDEGWLDGYVNNLKRDANTRLAKLHQENLLLMRKRFILIVTKHCEEVTKAVSTEDPNSRFGYVLATIKKVKEDSLARMSEQAEAYKKDCEEAYQARLRAEMENASSVARANFINRYGRDHERELHEIETDLRNNIESEFVASVDNLRAERRNEAKRQLDLGISEALKICGDEYVKMMAMERKEYIRLQAVITEFMNTNMAADDARIRTLAEEQRRSNEAVKVREEYDAALELAKSDFEAKVAAAKAEIEKRDVEHENYVMELRDQHEHMMQELRNSHSEAIRHKDHEIDLLNEQLSGANAQLDEMVRKYANLDHEAGVKYKTQIDMLASERDAWNERAEHVEKLHKYTDKLKVTGMVVVAAAMLGIGIIIGCVIMGNAKSNQAQQPAQGYVQQDPIIHYFIDGEEVDDPNGNQSENGNTANTDNGDGAAESGGAE